MNLIKFIDKWDWDRGSRECQIQARNLLIRSRLHHQAIKPLGEIEEGTYVHVPVADDYWTSWHLAEAYVCRRDPEFKVIRLKVNKSFDNFIVWAREHRSYLALCLVPINPPLQAKYGE